ncbi:hypothetical protein [Bradyrhizobium brasilense]|uniref:hypothetical protein n=1 Tax=Bradyrhizobium brasilense TaxID=1419277 RepID=UPI0014574693|nr:hypothetical protein [Bradyrhizobium brasilense]
MPDIVVTDAIASSIVQAIERGNEDFGGLSPASAIADPLLWYYRTVKPSALSAVR